MFYNKSKSCKKRRNNIIATKEVCIQNRDRFVLRNEKTIINKRKNRNENF